MDIDPSAHAGSKPLWTSQLQTGCHLLARLKAPDLEVHHPVGRLLHQIPDGGAEGRQRLVDVAEA